MVGRGDDGDGVDDRAGIGVIRAWSTDLGTEKTDHGATVPLRQFRYEARDRAALDAYLRDDAPRLRQHFVSTFPAGIELSREEWTVLERWPASP